METNQYIKWCQERIRYYRGLREQKLVELFEAALRLCMIRVEEVND